MDAQLMGAPGLRLKLEPGDRLAAPGASSEHPPERQRRLPVRVDLHPPAALVVQPAEGQVDRAAVRLRRAGDDRPVGLADLALLEQKPQFLQGFVVTPEDKAAGGVAIEAVRQRGLARQAEAERVEIVLEAGPALRPPMNRDASRLVEDEHQTVAIEQPRSCFFRRHEDIG